MRSIVRTFVALLLALALLPGPASAQGSLEIVGLPASAPFTISASVTELELTIDVELESEWHMYAYDVGGGRPVGVELAEDGAFAAAGRLRTPFDAHGQILGAARFVLPIQRVGRGTSITATLSYQVCDPLMCLPPQQLTIRGEVPPLRVLLVAADKGERTARIADWMRARQLSVDVATYADVTAERCDAHDVVVADSDYFGRHRVSTELVRAFPRTATPIVAVGFLGTELVQGQDVAMTSGYI
ncbi:MAG: protein-disulfide reductase DsbD family protein [Planctomycetota bacterium]